MLTTNADRGNVCCLASVNVEYFDEWKDVPEFIGDWADFLDNVLTDFIKRTEGNPHLERFRKGAIDERAIGLGVMGFHSLLQRKSIPFESAIAKGLNNEVFKHIKDAMDAHQDKVNDPCPMSRRTGSRRRNVHTTATAPTMSISTLANVTSSGIEPWLTNAFTKKVKQGAFPIRNKYLRALIDGLDKPTEWKEEQWKHIVNNRGSVQGLEWMSLWDKDVFKTAFEINQQWVIQHAADRVPYITQGQSLNLFVPGGSNVQLISDLHMTAWQKGLKGLYYLRSTAVNMASTEASGRKAIEVPGATRGQTLEDMNQDTCLGCS
jgi:ribonucleoside-diphosphate reductase alpha chain